jgi:hypothetical protein
MSTSLEEIRKKLQALENKSSGKFVNSDKTTYPHWNIPEGTSAVVRFLPDGDPNNTFFWVEKQVIKLTFPGIKGHDENKEVEVQVPCMEMYNDTCPILNEVRPMWKDPSLEETARKYWKKRSYIFQGFVKQNPLADDETPDNPIRKFIIGPQIFPLIKAALLDPELLNLPTDTINGLDFTLTKTSKGGFPDYTTSKWARRESSLTDEQQDAVQEHGLYNLSDFLPKKPTPEALAVIFEMFQASLEGELYDPDQWAKYYKPYGFDASGDDDDKKAAKAPARVPAKAPAKPVADDIEDDTPPFEPDTPKASESAPAAKSPTEILALLKNRNKTA